MQHDEAAPGADRDGGRPGTVGAAYPAEVAGSSVADALNALATLDLPDEDRAALWQRPQA